MAETISFRLDDDARRDLAQLQASGMSRSEAVRAGLRAAAARLRDRRALRDEAALLASDEDDVAEAVTVREMMEDLRATW